MKKSINIKEVAKTAGVSVTTVSRVINNNEKVKKQTRDKVLSVMKMLDYRPNINAIGLRTKKTKTIAVMIPDLDNPFYYDLLKKLEKYALEKDYSLLFTFNENIEKSISDLISRSIEGFILLSYLILPDTLKFLVNTNNQHPVVLLDYHLGNNDLSSVYTDGNHAFDAITSYLIKIGHKDIGIVTGENKYNIANDRFEGYKKAMKENNLEIKNEFVFRTNFSIDSGIEAGKYFANLEKLPSAIVCSNDLVALGLIRFLKESKIEVPKDISVTGFDNIHILKGVFPGITTFSQPIDDIAKKAVEITINAIEKNDSHIIKAIYKGNLVISNSTKKLEE